MSADNSPPSNLLAQFRIYYHQFQEVIRHVFANPTDPTVLGRLGDEIDEYLRLVIQNANIFDANELDTLRTNIGLMQTDIRQLYDDTLDRSHQGHPTIIETVHTNRRGRPRIRIDPDFLRWAYAHRSVSGISRFLHVGRSTVRNALIEYGFAEPQDNPFPMEVEAELNASGDAKDIILEDDLLDPNVPIPARLPDDIQGANPNHIHTRPGAVSFTRPLSTLPDDQLDNLIRQLRSHYHRVGVTILDGMLRNLGYRLSQNRIRESLVCIDPVQRVFQRIQIRRRHYSVPGPNALWHHDGQHGLIRWGIVIHGFIDGYSRLITGIRASDNNFASTVLDVFLHAANAYGVPLCLRGDHGTENIHVAAWMENHGRGVRRGSYIWGRSVHNVQIERLWVDVTVQVGAFWEETFTQLELRHGLDINNVLHIWLLHHLFLHAINEQLAFFAEGWNHHQIQIRDGPNRTPSDLFGFDMFVHGIRGDPLPDVDLTDEELEVYGVDWEGLRDERLLQSQRANNSNNEGWSSWVGRTGPPERLNDVLVDPPQGVLLPNEVDILDNALPWGNDGQAAGIVNLWTQGLVRAQQMYGGF